MTGLLTVTGIFSLIFSREIDCRDTAEPSERPRSDDAHGKPPTRVREK